VSNYYVPGIAGLPTALTINRTGRYVRVQLQQDMLSLAEVQVMALVKPVTILSIIANPTLIPTATNIPQNTPTTEVQPTMVIPTETLESSSTPIVQYTPTNEPIPTDTTVISPTP
jgi:hypothetical protein